MSGTGHALKSRLALLLLLGVTALLIAQLRSAHSLAALVALTSPMRCNKDAIGYLASLLVLGSFLSVSMIPLRILAIFSNVAFIIYGLQAHLAPVLILHTMLLPLNVCRLCQLVKHRTSQDDAAKAMQASANSQQS